MATDRDEDGPDLAGEARDLRQVASGLIESQAATRAQLAATTGMVESQRRSGRLLAIVVAVLVVLFLAAAGGGAYFVITTHEVVSKVRNGQLTGQATQRTIRDCVLPSGKCYQDNQRRTAEIIASIVDTNHNGRPDVQEILDALKAKG